MARKNSSVLILGGGAWGLSTALHMINSGYHDIMVLERAEQIPSQYSAAWDLNKIVRAEYEDPFYTKLALVGSLFTFVRTCHLKSTLRSRYRPSFGLSPADQDIESDRMQSKVGRRRFLGRTIIRQAMLSLRRVELLPKPFTT